MDTLMTVDEVAAVFQVVPKTINTWVRRGLLVATDLGGVRRFTRADVEAAQRRARREPPEAVEQTTPRHLAAVGQGWNESACRPYGMTMTGWLALGLTRSEWEARQAQPKRRGRRAS